MSFSEAVNSHSLASWEGRVTPDPTNEAYHALQGYYSSSDLKCMLESPLHFKRLVLEKHLLPQREPNEAFDLGSCAHECFLEQRTDGFVAAPKLDKRTKVGRETFKAFCDAYDGRRIIDTDQYAHLKAMFDKVAASPVASALASQGSIEASFLYKDPVSGLSCKFRPDVICLSSNSDLPSAGILTGQGYIMDYKTAQSASPYEFAKACARYQYALSAAHYIEGANRLFGPGAIKHYLFVVQEKTEPYAVAIYALDAGDLRRALDLRARILDKISSCVASDKWPDWSDRAHTLNIPAYAFNFDEES